jgi:hypothetical protein
MADSSAHGRSGSSGWRSSDRRAETLVEVDADLRAAEAEWHALLAVLSYGQINWRPDVGRWSVGEHLAHVNLVGASYLPHLDAMLERGRAAGPFLREGTRHPWLGWRLVRSTRPPVKLRVLTAAAFVPPVEVDPDAAVAELARVHGALRERITAAAGLDVGRMRARYTPGLGPAKLVVLSFVQWLAVTAAHDRRHLWLAEQVTTAPGFPAR